jgi:hypothetical protein
MSTIEVNKITPVSGGTTVQVGESGDTINIPAGATIANAGTASGFAPTGITSAMTSGTGLAIDSAGHITQPLQSAFIVKLGSTASNVTGDSTAYTVINYQTETIDRNADFNPSNGTFTAPITGLYLLTFRFHLQNIANNMNDNQLKMQTSNQSHSILGEMSSSSIGFSGSMNATGSLVVDMDANDTATMLVDFRGGSKVVDVHEDSFFMGYLLG